MRFLIGERVALIAIAALCIGLFALGTKVEAHNDWTKRDFAALQGYWVNHRDDETWHFSGDRLTRYVGYERRSDVRFELAREANARHIDLIPITGAEGDDEESLPSVARGLYALNNDELQVAFTFKFVRPKRDGVDGRAVQYLEVRPKSMDSDQSDVVVLSFARMDRKNVSRFKMAQIGLAMLRYESDQRHFPSAAALGPDGKTLHSWRVGMLPYLGKKEIHARYKFDQPWDSPANQELVKEAAGLFSAPAKSRKRIAPTS